MMILNKNLVKEIADSNQYFDQDSIKSENRIKILKNQNILEIDPNLIKNWKYHDRIPEEYGDLNSLASELKAIGQIQPCIVRLLINDAQYHYEIIVGERRWRAAKIAGIKLKAIQMDLTDHDAVLFQAAENSQRKNISEYSRGIHFTQLIKAGILTAKELQQNLQLSQSSIRNLLAFSKIKPEIIQAIGNFIKVSSTTAYEITRLQEKGSDYITAIISLAPQIQTGEIGYTTLQSMIAKIVNHTTHLPTAITIKTENGEALFSWRKDSNGQKSITFPKKIRRFLDYSEIEKLLITEIIRLIKRCPRYSG